MDTFFYIIITVMSMAIVIGFIYLIFRPKSNRDASDEYTAALNCLISGDKAGALKKLREVVHHNTNNVEAYIKIGDILREQGVYDRAIKIHRGLTVRRNLTLSQKIDLSKSLIEDYESAHKIDRAVSVADRLIELAGNEIWAQEIKLRVYENAEKWEEASEILKTLQKAKGEKDDSLLALYKIEAGLKLIQASKEREGRVKFREAIKLDRNCSFAYLNLSDSYMREERYKDALAELKKFMTQVPQLAQLAFHRIKNILYYIGSYGEIEIIFKNLLEKNPNNDTIRLALADVLERKGEINKAIDLCFETLDKNPDSRSAKLYLARYLPRLNRKDEALKFAMDLIEHSPYDKESEFVCQKCRYESTEPLWRCPKCFSWRTFLN